MAYWQEREAKEREQRRRPRSAAHDHAATAIGTVGASGSGNGKDGGDIEGLQTGSNGQWGDEKEEVLFSAVLVCLKQT